MRATRGVGNSLAYPLAYTYEYTLAHARWNMHSGTCTRDWASGGPHMLVCTGHGTRRFTVRAPRTSVHSRLTVAGPSQGRSALLRCCYASQQFRCSVYVSCGCFLPIILLVWMWLLDVSNSIVLLLDCCFDRTLFNVSGNRVNNVHE